MAPKKSVSVRMGEKTVFLSQLSKKDNAIPGTVTPLAFLVLKWVSWRANGQMLYKLRPFTFSQYGPLEKMWAEQ